MMIKRTTLCVLLTAAAMPALTGCMPKMTIEQMKADMPQRPVELDKLQILVGEWESTGEGQMGGLDRVLKTTGKLAFSWENDDWCLVERDEFDMEGLGKMKCMGVWTYDSRSKKYRNWWFDSMGGTGRGTGTYNDVTRTWKFKAKSRSEMGTTTGRGTMTFLDDDTITWTWSERAFLGLFKVVEFEGTMRRK